MEHRSHSRWPALHGTPRTTLVLALAASVLATAGVIVAATAGPASARPWKRSATTTTTRPAVTTTTTTPAASSTTTPTTAAPIAATTTTTKAPATTTTTKAPTTTTPTTAPATAPTAPSTSTSTVMFGAATEGGPWDFTNLNTMEADAGKKVSLYVYYQSFGYDANFNATTASAVRSRGATPMITWEPWVPGQGVNQPDYTLAKIASGAHDAYISRWASQIKTWGQPLWLRFAHEMNGDWYPWAEGVNGNGPGSYVAAWRHVVDVFRAAGVTNVTWVWSPNVSERSLAGLYPGDAYVNWVGVDGYNWGTSASWSGWQSPDQVFGTTLANLRAVSSKPIVIAETASAEVGGNKAQWIQQFFSMLGQNPDIKAFVWFNFNKETDWRIQSSSAARTAFATGIADPRYK